MSNEYQDQILNGKNRNGMKCKFCSSKILNLSTALYNSHVFKLPVMHQKKSEVDQTEMEELTDFWEVDDMYTFENIGFTHKVGNYKYLCCADCEMGPVGYHDMTNNKCYIALARVQQNIM